MTGDPRDDYCTCPSTPFRDDPYYQCTFCERRQEEAHREEDNEMTRCHRVFLEGRPATAKGPPIAAGYYGRPKCAGPISMNEQIYCRVTDPEEAWTYDSSTAVAIVRRFRRLGYPCRCEPPVTVVY